MRGAAERVAICPLLVSCRPNSASATKGLLLCRHWSQTFECNRCPKDKREHWRLRGCQATLRLWWRHTRGPTSGHNCAWFFSWYRAFAQEASKHTADALADTRRKLEQPAVIAGIDCARLPKRPWSTVRSLTCPDMMIARQTTGATRVAMQKVAEMSLHRQQTHAEEALRWWGTRHHLIADDSVPELGGIPAGYRPTYCHAFG